MLDKRHLPYSPEAVKALEFLGYKNGSIKNWEALGCDTINIKEHRGGKWFTINVDIGEDSTLVKLSAIENIPLYDYSRFAEYMDESDYSRAYDAMTGGLLDITDVVIPKGAQITASYHAINPPKFADIWERTKALMERFNG